MSRLRSGETLPNTECVAIAERIASASSGSLAASTPSPTTSMPTSRATADTVRGLSPESTFSATFCSLKYSSVARASGRTFSLKVSRVTGTRPSGSRSPRPSGPLAPSITGPASGAWASIMVRNPWAAVASACRSS